MFILPFLQKILWSSKLKRLTRNNAQINCINTKKMLSKNGLKIENTLETHIL